MAERMTDAFITKDSNGYREPFSIGIQESYVMDDGSSLDSASFKGTTPVTDYTPEELGINVEYSPFYTETFSAEADESTEVVIDEPQEPTNASLGGFNSWVVGNLGTILVSGLLLYGIYRFGLSRGKNNVA